MLAPFMSPPAWRTRPRGRAPRRAGRAVHLVVLVLAATIAVTVLPRGAAAEPEPAVSQASEMVFKEGDVCFVTASAETGVADTAAISTITAQILEKWGYANTTFSVAGGRIRLKAELPSCPPPSHGTYVDEIPRPVRDFVLPFAGQYVALFTVIVGTVAVLRGFSAMNLNVAADSRTASVVCGMMGFFVSFVASYAISLEPIPSASAALGALALDILVQRFGYAKMQNMFRAMLGSAQVEIRRWYPQLTPAVAAVAVAAAARAGVTLEQFLAQLRS